MKLGSLKEGGRDGSLIVVSRDLTRAVRATGIASTLQAALDDWSSSAPRLNALYAELNDGKAVGAFALDMAALAAPSPTISLNKLGIRWATKNASAKKPVPRNRARITSRKNPKILEANTPQATILLDLKRA